MENLTKDNACQSINLFLVYQIDSVVLNLFIKKESNGLFIRPIKICFVLVNILLLFVSFSCNKNIKSNKSVNSRQRKLRRKLLNK